MEREQLSWQERGQLWLRLIIRLVLAAAAVVLVAKLGPPLLSLFAPFVAALIVALILLLGGGGDSAETSAPTASSNDGRVKFLTDLGWDVTTSPTDSSQVRIPAASSDVFERYNALQKSQGYDLSEYAGKKVMRYVYKINNYPGATEPVYATLLVYKNQIIGGDVTDTAAQGKIRGFKMPEATTAPHGDRRHRAGDDPVNMGKLPRFLSMVSHNSALDKRPALCYCVTELNSIFRAGRNSPPAVKPASRKA